MYPLFMQISQINRLAFIIDELLCTFSWEFGIPLCDSSKLVSLFEAIIKGFLSAVTSFLGISGPLKEFIAGTSTGKLSFGDAVCGDGNAGNGDALDIEGVCALPRLIGVNGWRVWRLGVGACWHRPSL